MSHSLPRLSWAILSASILFLISIQGVSAGTLSCTVAGTCADTTVLKMSGTDNAHAEMPDQSNYSNLLCCSGVSGLGTNCSGTYVTVLKLSGTSNAHVEQNDQTNYANTPCLSVSGGSVSLAYQSTNCSGYDTTLGSISGTTNAHIGDASAYTTKICGTAASGGTLTIDIVDGNGDTVVSPSVAMNTGAVQVIYQTITGTLGVAAEKIRVNNGTGGAQWNVTMAASGGNTSFWDGASSDYDFNDPTANAVDGAGDADSLGGQLTVNPAVSTITPQGGCADTGLPKGSSTGFNQGTTDDITLLTAGATAQTSCYWDVTGIGLSQTVPAGQAAQSYSLPMTLTVTAI